MEETYIIIKSQLEEIDEFLMYLEDFTHGKDGVTVTKLRKLLSTLPKVQETSEEEGQRLAKEISEMSD